MEEAEKAGSSSGASLGGREPGPADTLILNFGLQECERT